jgi:hypothetical protein
MGKERREPVSLDGIADFLGTPKKRPFQMKDVSHPHY